MSGDIYFEPNSVLFQLMFDTLFILINIGASHLIDEMNIITESHVDLPAQKEEKPEPVIAQ